MKCRRIVDGKIVWFGSVGKTDVIYISDTLYPSDNLIIGDGIEHTIFYNDDNKHDNYSDKQQSVVDSLTQRLSILKGELWYRQSYGMPLFDKIKSKAIIDATVVQTVSKHPDVNYVKDFYSNVVDRQYHCMMTILTRYGLIDLQM